MLRYQQRYAWFDCGLFFCRLLKSPKTDKAKLISRMAKMGQPMLPGIIAAAPGQPGSDPDTEVSVAKGQIRVINANVCIFMAWLGLAGHICIYRFHA